MLLHLNHSIRQLDYEEDDLNSIKNEMATVFNRVLI